jgi:predicted O-linked N-acetylglucosamine transferase (SPINDLY family)
VAETSGDPLALLAAGRARLVAGDTADALALFRSACTALPDSSEAHFLLGAALHRLNQLADALAAFERALALDSGNLQAAHASLAVLCQLGRASDARDRVERLLEHHPNDSQLQYNAAFVFESLGNLTRAVEHYDRALQLAPGNFEALLNRGVALTRIGRLSEALENNLRLAAAHPGRAEAHFNLAEVSLALSRYEDALAHSERALAMRPQHAGAMLDRGLALAALGRLEDAHEVLAKAESLGARIPRSVSGILDITGDSVALRAGEIFITQAYARLEACDWFGFEGLTARFAAMIGAGEFSGFGSPALGFQAMMLGVPPPRQLQLAQQIATGWAVTPAKASPQPVRGPNGKIRVGYVSSDFRDHPMGHVTAPLLAHHDRTRYELFAYALSVSDGSEYRRRIGDACDHLAEASHLSNEDLARQIRQDAIDVLVNLNGYTTGHRTQVFAMRPAPIQVSYFGFPATMGASFIDYLIADRIVVPESDLPWYTESLVWLPHCYFSADPDERIPAAPPREAAGLPRRGVVLCNFNQHAKITPDVFAAWLRILRRVPGSVLWLLAGSGEANLRGHAEAAGVDPHRLVFAPRLPRPRHLARAQLADLVLDTRPCNAHTTAADALRAGAPVLTCPGDTFASRVAASLAYAAGLAELVVPNLDAYEELAVALAHDPDRLSDLKGRLASGLNTLPVFDVAGRTRELESAYSEMVARNRRGLPPTTLSVRART